MAAERERDQTHHPYDDYTSDEEEDYIDMEVSSNSNCNSNWFFTHSSSASTREFEFQMLSTSSNSERETTTSPADELFYKGKLLPLHLPPRLQMVEKLLLQNSNNHIIDKTDSSSCLFEECFSTPLPTNTFTTPLANTPFESCNISPSESCQVSRELNPDDYFFDYSGATAEDDDITIPKRSCWTRKLGSKLKASRAYLKSLFSKPGDETFAVSKAKESFDNKKHANKSPFGQIQMPAAGRSFNKDKFGAGHRRSFSGAIKRLSAAKSSSSSSSSSSFSSSSSSSSSSSNSNCSQYDSQYLKRSSSMNQDIENSIQSAIAHCKRSQQNLHSRKAASEAGFCSLSAAASRLVYEDQERPGLRRG